MRALIGFGSHPHDDWTEIVVSRRELQRAREYSLKCQLPDFDSEKIDLDFCGPAATWLDANDRPALAGHCFIAEKLAELVRCEAKLITIDWEFGSLVVAIMPDSIEK